MALNHTDVNSLSLHDAALWYALAGYRVFPLPPGRKDPYRGSAGFRAATDDLTTIHLWWSCDPHANIGICAPKDHLFVDLDVKQGKNGLLSWLELGGELGRWPQQTTPSGGMHIRLPFPDWLAPRDMQNCGLYGGIDTKWGGSGYVVAAPSRTEQGVYQWVPGSGTGGDPSPDLLRKLAELGLRQRQRRPATGKMHRPEAVDITTDQVNALLAQLPEKCREWLETGEQWQYHSSGDSWHCYTVVLDMWRRNWSEEQIDAVLQDSYAATFAERHRPGGGMSWLWSYTIPAAKAWVEADREVIRHTMPGPAQRDWSLPEPQRDWSLPELQTDWCVPELQTDWCLPDLPTDWSLPDPELQRDWSLPEPPVASSADPFSVLRGRILALDPLDPHVNQRAEVVLQEIAAAPLTAAQIEDLKQALNKYARVRKQFIGQIWGHLQEQRTRQRVGNTEPAEIYVVAQAKLLHRISGTMRSREAFLIEKAREFGGDKAAAEEHYLTGQNPACTLVDDLTYHPGMPPGVVTDERGTRLYNRYRPSTVVPRAGDISLWLGLLDTLDIEGGPEVRERLLDYMAYTVQYPGEKINHGVLIGGPHGLGKDSLFVPWWRCVGAWNVQTVRGEELTGSFTGYLNGCKALNVQECEFGSGTDSRRVSARLKSLLAAPPEVIRVNEKNVREYTVPNLCSAIIFTNHPNRPLHLDPGERRYLGIWCQGVPPERGTPEREQTDRWFASYYNWLDNGGTEAIYHYLLTRDLSRFNPKMPPITTPYTIRIQNSGRTRLAEWIVDGLVEERGWFALDVVPVNRLLEQAKIDQSIGLLSAQAYIGRNTVLHAFQEVGCHDYPFVHATREWHKQQGGQWLILRNRAEALKKGNTYWRNLLACADSVGPEQALQTPEWRRAGYRWDSYTKGKGKPGKPPVWL